MVITVPSNYTRLGRPWEPLTVHAPRTGRASHLDEMCDETDMTTWCGWRWKELDVWQTILWRSAAERLPRYSFPHRSHKQIHFLSVLHDAIQQTGNNTPLFSPSVILLSAIRPPASRLHLCFWYLSVSLLVLQTAYYNDLSVSRQKVLYSLLVKVISPPTVHSYPTSFDPVTAHLNIAENVTLQSQQPWCRWIPLLHLWCAGTFFYVCVFEMTSSWHQWSWSLEEITSCTPLPSTVSASFN